MTSLTRAVKSFKKQAHLDFKAGGLTQHFFSHWQWHAAFLLMSVVFYFFLDRPIAVYCHEHADFFSLLHVTRSLGEGESYFILFLCLIMLAKLRAYPRWVARYMFLFCWFSFIYGACVVLKILLGRARPMWWFSDHLFGFYGPSFQHLYHSFPSGHTTIWVLLACYLGLLFPRYMKGFFLVALLGGLTRILLTDHYVSDVLGTIYFTCLVWFSLLNQLQKESA